MSSNQQDLGRVNLKNVCVLQRGNEYYYPKTIPRERGPLSDNICLAISVVLFLVDFCTNRNETSTFLALYILGILVSIVLQLSKRTILAVEELKHLSSRYEGDVKNLLRNAFQFPIKVWVVLAVSVIYAVYYCCTNDTAKLPFDFRSIAFALPSVYFFTILLDLECSPLNDSLWIAENNGLDYGSGMAYSFYYGYLKLVLPKSGTEEKNLRELMQDYEGENQIYFSAYKLFILIPKSLTCFVSLEDDNFPSVEESSSLPAKIITVAGVKDRVYKNAVYKINTGKPENKIYVSAEYATPLRTFAEVVNHAGIHTEYYNKHKNDIILQFYLTLKKVLEKDGLNEFCELIYYEDYVEDGSPKKNYYDVGKIILARLKELKKNQNKKND